MADAETSYVRRTDQMEVKPIAGTEGGIRPSLSPDDRGVGSWSPVAERILVQNWFEELKRLCPTGK